VEEQMTAAVSRRSLLALGAGLTASTMLGSNALARAPKLGTQSPYFHRFVLGGAEVTVVSDGPLPLGPPKGTFIGASDDEIKKMLTDNFLSPDNIVLEQNSPIVNMGDKLVLFDTGMGAAKTFGPTTGRQQRPTRWRSCPTTIPGRATAMSSKPAKVFTISPSPW
jgi:hypothetical protein